MKKRGNKSHAKYWAAMLDFTSSNAQRRATTESNMIHRDAQTIDKRFNNKTEKTQTDSLTNTAKMKREKESGKKREGNKLPFWNKLMT